MDLYNFIPSADIEYMNSKQITVVVYILFFAMLAIISTIFYMYNDILPFKEFIMLVGVFIFVNIVDKLAEY